MKRIYFRSAKAEENKLVYYIGGILVAVLVLGFILNQFVFSKSSPAPTAVSSPTISPSVSPQPTPLLSPSPIEKSIPNAYLIDNFPFQPQAPFANWDETHDEACEEASVILVQWWQSGKSSISASTMDEEILKMVDWQIAKWGTHKDLTIQETAEMAENFYGLKLVAQYDVTIEDIKKEIAENHPIIFPAAGRLLGNPYFRSPGPIYHMSVIIGYEGNNFIVQDVGTKRGENYKYNQKVLFNALHDWAGSPESIEQGQKAILIF
ncbi:MAG: C39 family peptidase [Patescibacteria group bacterium]